MHMHTVGIPMYYSCTCTKMILRSWYHDEFTCTISTECILDRKVRFPLPNSSVNYFVSPPLWFTVSLQICIHYYCCTSRPYTVHHQNEKKLTIKWRDTLEPLIFCILIRSTYILYYSNSGGTIQNTMHSQPSLHHCSLLINEVIQFCTLFQTYEIIHESMPRRSVQCVVWISRSRCAY